MEPCPTGIVSSGISPKHHWAFKMYTELSNVEHATLKIAQVTEKDVYGLLEPSREKDLSDVLGEMVWHVCHLFLMYRKPVFNPEKEALLSSQATKEEIGQQLISFAPLSSDRYPTVGHFLREVAIEETWYDLDGNVHAMPRRRQRLVHDAFQQRAPIKMYVEKRLGIRNAVGDERNDWLVDMAKTSEPFRYWWQEITNTLMMRLERLPMETAIAWQGLRASSALQAQDQAVRLLNEKSRAEIEAAKKAAGGSLVSWIDRQVGGRDRYYDASNFHYLLQTLDCLANVFGKERVSAALFSITIYGTPEVKEELLAAYPYIEKEA